MSEIQKSLDLLHDDSLRRAIDNFCTGYSSLAYTPKPPADVVKIDRSFVADMALRPSCRDTCLKIIANTARATCRVFAGSIVARYGGEELTVILPNASLSETEVAARLICTHLRTLAIEHVESKKRIVTVSLGAANLKSLWASGPSQFQHAWRGQRNRTGDRR